MGVAVLSPTRSSLLPAPDSKRRRSRWGFETTKSNISAARWKNDIVATPPFLPLPISSKTKQHFPSTDAKVSSSQSAIVESRSNKRSKVLTTSSSPQKSHQQSYMDLSPAAQKPLPNRGVLVNIMGLNSTGLLGSKPKNSQPEVEIELYAGAGFFISPLPSSVPIPAFARKLLSKEVAASSRTSDCTA